MLLPALRDTLEARLGVRVTGTTPLTGGMINQVARIESSDGPLLVKWHSAAPPGLFAAEADGLRALASTGAIRVPEVLAWDDVAMPFLAMEFLPVAPLENETAFTRRFAEQLAHLHRESTIQCGWESDNYLGVFPQPNAPRTENWAHFYRDCRLLPQIQRAERNDHLPHARRLLLETVVSRLGTILTDLPPERSLLHGDLWAGNFLCLPGDVPALIDPAVYYGPREIEIAYIELFGGFLPGFVEAYRAVWPLSPTYEHRRALHQLHPLLVHLNCFGAKYGPWVERACHDALR